MSYLKYILCAASLLWVTGTFADEDGVRRYPDLPDPFMGPPPPVEQEDAPPPHPRMSDQGQDENWDEETVFEELEKGAAASQLNPGQMMALERFLEMPPEKLASIRQVIERIEAMSEEEKSVLRERIREYQDMQKDKLNQLREAHRRWKSMPPEDQQLLMRYMATLSPEQRRDIRKSIFDLNESDRQALMQDMLERARAADEAGELPECPPPPPGFRGRGARSGEGPAEGPEGV